MGGSVAAGGSAAARNEPRSQTQPNVREYLQLGSLTLPRPVNVPNLLELAPNDAYTTYARLVSPLLILLGTSITWAGQQHVEAIAGERLAADAAREALDGPSLSRVETIAPGAIIQRDRRLRARELLR